MDNINSVMKHKQVAGFFRGADFQSGEKKLVIYPFQNSKKIIFKDENGEELMQISASLVYDEDNSRLIFLNKQIQNYQDALTKEYKDAVKNGFIGSKKDYFYLRDYT